MNATKLTTWYYRVNVRFNYLFPKIIRTEKEKEINQTRLSVPNHTQIVWVDHVFETNRMVKKRVCKRVTRVFITDRCMYRNKYRQLTYTVINIYEIELIWCGSWPGDPASSLLDQGEKHRLGLFYVRTRVVPLRQLSGPRGYLQTINIKRYMNVWSQHSWLSHRGNLPSLLKERKKKTGWRCHCVLYSPVHRSFNCVRIHYTEMSARPPSWVSTFPYIENMDVNEACKLASPCHCHELCQRPQHIQNATGRLWVYQEKAMDGDFVFRDVGSDISGSFVVLQNSLLQCCSCWDPWMERRSACR